MKVACLGDNCWLGNGCAGVGIRLLLEEHDGGPGSIILKRQGWDGGCRLRAFVGTRQVQCCPTFRAKILGGIRRRAHEYLLSSSGRNFVRRQFGSRRRARIWSCAIPTDWSASENSQDRPPAFAIAPHPSQFAPELHARGHQTQIASSMGDQPGHSRVPTQVCDWIQRNEAELSCKTSAKLIGQNDQHLILHWGREYRKWEAEAAGKPLSVISIVVFLSSEGKGSKRTV